MRKFRIILVNCLLVITMAACTSHADKIEPANNTIKVEETPLNSTGDTGAGAVNLATSQPTSQPDNSEKTIVFSTF